jgi:uncharacterized membrane protein YoaK (UPF0700 family)
MTVGRIGIAWMAALFFVGAAGGLVGDMCHVVSGTTRYIEDPLPYIWESQLWFPLMVGSGTVVLGVIRVRLGDDGEGGGMREAAQMIAWIIALYALTALVRSEPQEVAVAIVYAVAAAIAGAFAHSRADVVCGALAAVVGVTIEIVLAAEGVFEYADDVGDFAGVATWLPALYFAFGVVAGRLGLTCARASAAPAPSGS